jgi:LacI family transcriptional regulator
MRQEWVIEAKVGGNEYLYAFETLRAMLETRARPDAVIACSDLTAAGAYDAAISRGLRIPGQFQILGCGNDPEICSIGPGISSIDLCSEEIGVRAARLALRAIEKKGDNGPQSIAVSPRLVQRATTKLLDD